MAATKAHGEAFVPSGPLVRMIEGMAFREGRPESLVCINLGVNPRDFKAWRSGGRSLVTLWAADRALTRSPYGSWDSTIRTLDALVACGLDASVWRPGSWGEIEATLLAPRSVVA